MNTCVFELTPMQEEILKEYFTVGVDPALRVYAKKLLFLFTPDELRQLVPSTAYETLYVNRLVNSGYCISKTRSKVTNSASRFCAWINSVFESGKHPEWFGGAV